MNLTSIFMIVQFGITVIIGLYFYSQLKNQEMSKVSLEKESKKKLENLQKMRKIQLSQPLSEKTRPTELKEVIGQENGIKALKAALCGPNPQHVIIYGPPGVGKTAAARVILEEGKKIKYCPFGMSAKFVEMDATILRFDERGIADPLIGSVHDPIYQGAGAYGPAGVPQPKPGAVTKAHGGVLFLDEIGELHPVQINKLLKVLEDRKVKLESSYYSSENTHIPSYVHDIFENGLPADFRLVGATTRTPDEIPPAIRSRCTEIFFNSLKQKDILTIVKNGAEKAGFNIEDNAVELISKYADNGRDAVNILQTSGCIATMDQREHIIIEDVEWVLEFGQYSPKVSKKIEKMERVGCANGIGVFGSGMGHVLPIEVIAEKVESHDQSELTITGFIEEEEIKRGNQKLIRGSTSKASIKNVLTLIKNRYKIDYRNYKIHINVPGGIPVDGPSAGTAIFCAIYSALTNKVISSDIAMTGEVSIVGKVLPVGGVQAKVTAAYEAGATQIFIPKDNWKESYKNYDIKITPISDVNALLEKVFKMSKTIEIDSSSKSSTDKKEVLTAQGMN